MSKVQGKKYNYGDRLVGCAERIIEPSVGKKSDSDSNLGYWTLDIQNGSEPSICSNPSTDGQLAMQMYSQPRRI